MSYLKEFLVASIILSLSGFMSPITLHSTNTVSRLVNKPNPCENKFRCSILQVKILATGALRNDTLDIIIDPAGKKISILPLSPIRKKVGFDINITSTECKLINEHTNGEATYTGYIKQMNGTQTQSTILLYIDNDKKISITESDPSKNRKANVEFLVSKWEYIE